jgi:6-pyruvoyltetrahydropterin/6-carboxytetrahydropterin synthase
VEPCVELSAGGTAFALSDLEQIADGLIIQRFDHKNLNTDTQEFLDGSGLNPSVENIARVCFDLLQPAVNRPGVTLRSVTVWESDRTSCTYPG